VTHEPAFGRPAKDFLGTVDGETILAFLPDCYTLVVGSRGQEGPIRRVPNHVGVFVGLTETIEDA
jgi:hypothetical protein